MPSPFPGMDPYLEAPEVFPGIHGALPFCMQEVLIAELPARYAARMDRYVWIHEPSSDERQLLGGPDVFVSDVTSEGPSVVTLAAPVTVAMPVERRKGPKYVRIMDTHSRRVVTVIEILSPSNKARGEDRDAYIAKRNDYLGTGVSLVEIDLLRSGVRMPLGRSAPPRADYYVLISRPPDFPQAGLWPISVRDRLPTIPIPLLPEDPPASLALQPCLDRVYEAGRFRSEVDYTAPPVPPLTELDATWARQLLDAYLAQHP